MEPHVDISELDLRRMVRLLSSLTLLDGDLALSKRFLVSGLCTLIDADSWLYAMFPQRRECSGSSSSVLIYDGFDDVCASQLLQKLGENGVTGLTNNEENEKSLASGFIPANARGSDEFLFFQTCSFVQGKPFGVGPSILSSCRKGERTLSLIGLFRRSGSRHFTRREQKMAQILLSEVTWLHQPSYPDDSIERILALGPQQRRILNLLLIGLDRKSIAGRLKISVNTVAGYCKDLYRHFNVHSQATLIAYFVAGNSDKDLTFETKRMNDRSLLADLLLADEEKTNSHPHSSLERWNGRKNHRLNKAP